MSRNAFLALEREHTADMEQVEDNRAALAEWRAAVAASLAPDTAESVQASAVAENQSRQIPRTR